MCILKMCRSTSLCYFQIIIPLELVLSDIVENSLHGCESLTVITTVRNSQIEVTLNLLLKCGFTFFFLSFFFKSTFNINSLSIMLSVIYVCIWMHFPACTESKTVVFNSLRRELGNKASSRSANVDDKEGRGFTPFSSHLFFPNCLPWFIIPWNTWESESYI